MIGGNDYIIERKEELVISNLNLTDKKIYNIIKEIKSNEIMDVPKKCKRIIKKKYVYPITVDVLTTIYLFSNFNKEKLYDTGTIIKEVFRLLYEIYT